MADSTPDDVVQLSAAARRLHEQYPAAWQQLLQQLQPDAPAVAQRLIHRFAELDVTDRTEQQEARTPQQRTRNRSTLHTPAIPTITARVSPSPNHLQQQPAPLQFQRFDWDANKERTDKAAYCRELQTLLRAGCLPSVSTIASLRRRSKIIMAREPNVLSPSKIAADRVVVVGDLHGQLDTLLHILDEFGQPHTNGDDRSVSYVFLGDYLDRGQSSIGVVCLLLAYKLFADSAVVVALHRGNHEDQWSEAQKTDSFVNQCKRAEVYGRTEEWSTVVADIYDICQYMPIAAVYDSTVCFPGGCKYRFFLVHGGIGSQFPLYNDLNSVCRFHAVPVNAASGEPPCANAITEALWNDPVPTEPLDAGTALHYRNYSDWYTTMANDHSTPPNLSGDDDWCGENGDCDPRKWYANSFYTNTARKVGKFYSQRALRAFCYYNQLDGVVRAHEFQTNMYETSMNMQFPRHRDTQKAAAAHTSLPPSSPGPAPHQFAAFDYQLITIFSAPNPQQGLNIAAVLVMQKNSVETVRLQANYAQQPMREGSV